MAFHIQSSSGTDPKESKKTTWSLITGVAGLLVTILLALGAFNWFSGREDHVLEIYSKISDGDVTSQQCNNVANALNESAQTGYIDSNGVHVPSGKSLADWAYSYKLRRCFGMLLITIFDTSNGFANEVGSDYQIIDLITMQPIADCKGNNTQMIKCNDLVGTYSDSDANAIDYPLQNRVWPRLKILLSS